MGLELIYHFTSRPNPIRASPDSGSPNVIALDIVLTNRAIVPVTLRSVKIEIPIGSERDVTLSTASKLPAPPPDAVPGWKIDPPVGRDLILKPASGDSAKFSGSAVITLDPITVNKTAPASVPITITETPVSGASVIDGDTYSLYKEKATSVVTNFEATPAVVRDLDKYVCLTWTVTEAGEDLGYAVHSDSWWPKDCLKGLDCYTADCGRKGVKSGLIEKGPSVTFALDVINKQNGTPSLEQTVTTTVRVAVPSMSSSLEKQLSRSGRLVALHWIAWDADACLVQLDGDPVDKTAPLDTYGPGWFWLLDGPDREHDFDVIAYAATGPTATVPVPKVRTHDPTTLDLGQNAEPRSMALARSGSAALVTSSGGLRLIDLAAGAAERDAIVATGRDPAVATTPLGDVAFVSDFGTAALTVVDMTTSKPKLATAIPLAAPAANVAVAPGGKLAAVASENAVQKVDIIARKAGAAVQVAQQPMDMAFTPDGTTLLVASATGEITPVDVGTWRAGKRMSVTLPISRGGQTWYGLAGLSGVAVTPDGHTALAVDGQNSMLYAFDLPAGTLAWSEPVGSWPAHMVITADSRLALVTSSQDGQLLAFDLHRKTTIGAIPLQPGVGAVALAPDTSVLAVANWSVGTVTLI